MTGDALERQANKQNLKKKFLEANKQTTGRVTESCKDVSGRDSPEAHRIWAEGKPNEEGVPSY